MTDLTIEERINICLNCDHLILKSIAVCGKCFCPVRKKAKRNTGCPLGKW